MARMRLSAAAGHTVTQQAFAALMADRLGMPWHQARLSRLEANDHEPSLAELMAVCDLTGVSLPWLAYGIDVVDPVSPTDRAAWLTRHREQQPTPPPPARTVGPRAARGARTVRD